jgi:hypothetical protein
MGMLASTSSEKAGMHVGEFEEVSVLCLLVLEWFDVRAEGFVGLATVQLLYAEGLVVRAEKVNRDVGVSGILDGGAAASEVPIDEMVLALGKLQGAAAGPEEVVPDLSVCLHSGEESVVGVLVSDSVFVVIAVIIVDKACHVD